MVSTGSWRLFWWNEHPSANDKLEAVEHLQVWHWAVSNRKQMAVLPALRAMLLEHGASDIWRATDDAVVALLTRYLASGLIRIYRLQRTEVSGFPTPARPPAFPLSERKAAAASAPAAAPESAVFPDDVEPVALAGVLTTAAESGIPFCEECAKAAAAAAGKGD